ncbi:MAG: hypothetical protein ACI8ZM_004359 [Crocinitomix sp.]|jgi:hypothetical protein
MTALDNFYLDQKEPLGSCLIALRDLIKAYDSQITERWYYRLPCFFYQDKMFCYVWIEKKTNDPYIAFYPGSKLQHPQLEQGNRTQSKILRLKSNKDLPLETIYEIIKESLNGRK